MAVLAVVLYCAIDRVLTGVFKFGDPLSYPLRLTSLAVIIPAAAAGFFVYRHTARERKTQALITFLLTILLAVAILTTVSRIF